MNVITMQTTTKTNQRAAARYTELHAESKELLKRIATRLAKHKQKQATAPADWGYVGDMVRVNEQLAYVLASLGDRSAVEAKGLEY